jgi:hypothetical protein
MTEFEIVDDELVMVCQHEWSSWVPYPSKWGTIEERICFRCGIKQKLVPRGYDKC